MNAIIRSQKPHLDIDAHKTPQVLVSAYVKALDKAVKLVRKLSQKHQDTLVDNRLKDVVLRKKNTHKPDDIVLRELDQFELHDEIGPCTRLLGKSNTYMAMMIITYM